MPRPVPFSALLVVDEVGDVHMRSAALAAQLWWHEGILPAACCLWRILPAHAAWSMARHLVSIIHATLLSMPAVPQKIALLD